MKSFSDCALLNRLRVSEEIDEMNGIIKEFSKYKIKHMHDESMPLNDETILLAKQRLAKLEIEYARLVESKTDQGLAARNANNFNIAW